MLMYVKASGVEACQPFIHFFFSDVMRKNLHRGDFYLADEFDWNRSFCFPDWNLLFRYDYEDLNLQMDMLLRNGIRPEVSQKAKFV